MQIDAVVVHGATNPGATIEVDGQTVFVAHDGRFQAEVTLSPGTNVIEVIAMDAFANQERAIRTVVYEIPPAEAFFLLIIEPESQSVVQTSPLTLSGHTVSDAIVSVSGVGVNVDEQGAFSTTVALEPGPNIIDVVATNPEGRILSAVVAVIYRP